MYVFSLGVVVDTFREDSFCAPRAHRRPILASNRTDGSPVRRHNRPNAAIAHLAIASVSSACSAWSRSDRYITKQSLRTPISVLSPEPGSAMVRAAPLILLLLHLAASAAQCTCTANAAYSFCWTGATSTSWSLASNWDTSGAGCTYPGACCSLILPIEARWRCPLQSSLQALELIHMRRRERQHYRGMRVAFLRVSSLLYVAEAAASMTSRAVIHSSTDSLHSRFWRLDAPDAFLPLGIDPLRSAQHH